LAFACVAVSPSTLAVVPPPDGGYPVENTAEGNDALFSLTTGADNTAIGFNTLWSNTTGLYNTATGAFALYSNTTGDYNTATGGLALYSNTSGSDNTAAGFLALVLNTSGDDNTATGSDALHFNTTGNDNTATGAFALYSNTTGFLNTAAGSEALFYNTTGYYNTATGSQALFFNTGNDNTATGTYALFFNQGDDNTTTGYSALYSNTAGNDNTATGFYALAGNTTGSSNIALGYQAGVNLTTGNNNIDIGNAGVAGESSKIRIGTKPAQKATFIAGISGVTVANGVGVIVNTQGQLGTVVSSARYKEAIKPMDTASEAILALKPVTFRYKHDLDPDGVPQFGLVAEEVEKVNPALVARDEQGKPYTVRYEAVNAMLLNEFLKEHRKNEEQEARIARQQKQIEALTSGLQKVSAQLEASKPAPQVVNNQ
jgi:Chaperone of endosialidase